MPCLAAHRSAAMPMTLACEHANDSKTFFKVSYTLCRDTICKQNHFQKPHLCTYLPTHNFSEQFAAASVREAIADHGVLPKGQRTCSSRVRQGLGGKQWQSASVSMPMPMLGVGLVKFGVMLTGPLRPHRPCSRRGVWLCKDRGH